MIRAFAQARRNPREVDFLELHSTGTAMGDPTEANWVGKEFCRDDELIVGSVKGNIGYAPPSLGTTEPSLTDDARITAILRSPRF